MYMRALVYTPYSQQEVAASRMHDPRRLDSCIQKEGDRLQGGIEIVLRPSLRGTRSTMPGIGCH